MIFICIQQYQRKIRKHLIQLWFSFSNVELICTGCTKKFKQRAARKKPNDEVNEIDNILKEMTGPSTSQHVSLFISRPDDDGIVHRVSAPRKRKRKSASGEFNVLFYQFILFSSRPFPTFLRCDPHCLDTEDLATPSTYLYHDHDGSIWDWAY